MAAPGFFNVFGVNCDVPAIIGAVGTSTLVIHKTIHDFWDERL